MEQLSIKEKYGSNYIMYELSGILNSYTSADFRDKVYDAVSKTTVVVELSQITSIDSTGVGIIMASFNDSEDSGHKFYLMNPSPAARTALEETGFIAVFKFIHSITEIVL